MGKPTEEDNVEASAYGNPGYNDLNDDTYPGGSELEKDEKVYRSVKPGNPTKVLLAEKRTGQD